MKFVGALKKYMEAEPHGTKVPLAELAAFCKMFKGDERAAAVAELRSYGYDIEEDSA